MTLLKDQPPQKAGGDSEKRQGQAGDPLGELQKFGQSVWLDYIRRNLIDSGELQRMVADDHLSGITSNPSIFEKAIAGSTDYDGFLASAAKCKGHDAMTLYERLAIKDIKDAADVLRPIYERTGRADGYISLEVSPYLAHDTQATIAEARRLWNTVGRENMMVKVPATPEGLPAVRQLISEGININITLFFSRKVYQQVSGAYMDGLESLASRGGDISRVASVASFFVSRIDTLVDSLVGIPPCLVARMRKSNQRCGRSWGESRSPMQSSRISRSKNYAGADDGRPWSKKGAKCNGCSGPVRARRIQNIPICCTSKNLSARTPLTLFRRLRWMHSAIMGGPGPVLKKISTTPAASCKPWLKWASPWMMSPTNCSTTACGSFRNPSISCSPQSKKSGKPPPEARPCLKAQHCSIECFPRCFYDVLHNHHS